MSLSNDLYYKKYLKYKKKYLDLVGGSKPEAFTEINKILEEIRNIIRNIISTDAKNDMELLIKINNILEEISKIGYIDSQNDYCNNKIKHYTNLNNTQYKTLIAMLQGPVKDDTHRNYINIQIDKVLPTFIPDTLTQTSPGEVAIALPTECSVILNTIHGIYLVITGLIRTIVAHS